MPDTPLGRLVGTWELEPSIGGQSPGKSSATFEWIEGGAFLLQRSMAEWTDPGWVKSAPKTSQAVIGFDDTTMEITQLYADDRGVTRIYRGTLTEEQWLLERSAPGFHQRFIGEFRDDGRTIDGRWEVSPDGSNWELDFPIIYRRTETAS